MEEFGLSERRSAMLTVETRTQDESKRWYVSAVRGELVTQYGFLEEEADRIIEAYKLRERLNVAPDAQLHMDIADTAREMRRDGFFEYSR